MPEFYVEVQETIVRTVSVTAGGPREAEKKAVDRVRLVTLPEDNDARVVHNDGPFFEELTTTRQPEGGLW